MNIRQNGSKRKCNGFIKYSIHFGLWGRSFHFPVRFDTFPDCLMEFFPSADISH